LIDRAPMTISPPSQDRRIRTDIVSAVLVSASVLAMMSALPWQAARRQKSSCQTLVLEQADDVQDPMLTSHVDCSISAAVVDHQPFNNIDVGEAPRKRDTSCRGLLSVARFDITLS
jgi:hypothetical protein